jgi:hypothetical protein
VELDEAKDRARNMTEPPQLAIFYDQYSASIFEIIGAAHDWCRIVWVVGWSPNVPPIRALSRFGDVVDLTGMNDTQAVEHLVALQPDGVVVFDDPPMRLAAAVAEQLGLPFHSPHTARLMTDKLAQRTALQQAGLPVPAFAAVRFGEIGAEVPFPAVLKPRAGAGSRDTFKVGNREQVADALAKCDQDEEFILEEWLPDRTNELGLGSDLVSVESVVRNGVIEHIMVTGRFPLAPPFRETGSFLPSDLGPADQDPVAALAGAASEAMQVLNGLLHTEIKMTPEGPRIVEINGRVGGGISGMIARLGGPSLHVWAVRLALGQDVGSVPVFPESSVAFFRWIVAPLSATKVESVSGLDELSALAGIDEVRLNLLPGDVVDSREGSPRGHVIRIDGMVGSHAELAVLIHEQIESALHLTWSFNE